MKQGPEDICHKMFDCFGAMLENGVCSASPQRVCDGAQDADNAPIDHDLLEDRI